MDFLISNATPPNEELGQGEHVAPIMLAKAGRRRAPRRKGLRIEFYSPEVGSLGKSQA